MKTRILILLSALLLAAMPAVAQQKFACVNTDYVLRSVPDYANAQKRLDKYAADWAKELADKQAEIEVLRAEYEQESYLLPENLKKRRQDELKTKEQELRALQQQRFGAGGDLDKKRAELLKPVQDRVYAAIERIAQEKNYAFVFDKAGSPAVLFSNKKFVMLCLNRWAINLELHRMPLNLPLNRRRSLPIPKCGSETKTVAPVARL